MELYNNYIRKHVFIKNFEPNNYVADVAFVDIDGDSIVKRVETYVTFNSSLNIPKSYYRLRYFSLDDKIDFIKKNSDIIKDISQTLRYYSYVKIINDKNNPSLNEKILPFFFGFKIYSTISDDKDLLHENVFRLDVSTVGPYLNFDKCHFIDTKYNVKDKSLYLENKFFKKSLDITQFRRILKLKKLNLM